MAKKRFKAVNTPSAMKRKAEALRNGRGDNQAFTSGARSTSFDADNPTAMKNAWGSGQNVQTYTRSKSGKLSAGGGKAGGLTWTMSDKDNDRQSGRSKPASRRQRDYDVRKGLNNDQRSPEALARLARMGITFTLTRGLTTG